MWLESHSAFAPSLRTDRQIHVTGGLVSDGEAVLDLRGPFHRTERFKLSAGDFLLAASSSAALAGRLAGPRAASGLQERILVGIGVDQQLERFIVAGRIAGARLRIELVARGVIGNDVAVLELEVVAEAGLDDIGRNGDLVGDELGPGERAADLLAMQR